MWGDGQALWPVAAKGAWLPLPPPRLAAVLTMRLPLCLLSKIRSSNDNDQTCSSTVASTVTFTAKAGVYY